jgi:hypothetical protein
MQFNNNDNQATMGLVFDEYLYQSDLTDNYNKNNKKK